MKQLFIIFACLFCLSFAQAQRNDPEIGIVEHLEDTIPLNLTFIDENNQKVVLKDMIDKPTVFAFVYFNCPGICSPLQEGMRELFERSDLEMGKDYQVITISFDYSDTPDKAAIKKKNFVSKFSEKSKKAWHYLTGDSATIAEITNKAGFKYKKTGLDFIHAGVLIMVSPQGKITRYLYGLKFLPFDFKMAVIESQQGLSRPAINKVLDFCFSYDPQGKRYALEVTKIIGSIILFVLIIFFGFLIFRRKKMKPVQQQ